MYQPTGCITSPKLFNRTMAIPWLLHELKSSTTCVYLLCMWLVIRSSLRKPSFRYGAYFGPAEIFSISLLCLHGKFLNHQASKSSMWTEYLVKVWIFNLLKICPVSCKHSLRVFYDFYVMWSSQGLNIFPWSWMAGGFSGAAVSALKIPDPKPTPLILQSLIMMKNHSLLLGL